MDVAVLKRLLSCVLVMITILSGVEAVGGVVKAKHIDRNVSSVSTLDTAKSLTVSTSPTDSSTTGHTEYT